MLHKDDAKHVVVFLHDKKIMITFHEMYNLQYEITEQFLGLFEAFSFSLGFFVIFVQFNFLSGFVWIAMAIRTLHLSLSGLPLWMHVKNGGCQDRQSCLLYTSPSPRD